MRESRYDLSPSISSELDPRLNQRGSRSFRLHERRQEGGGERESDRNKKEKIRSGTASCGLAKQISFVESKRERTSLLIIPHVSGIN